MGAAAHEPPQSTSLSLPFFSASLQLAGVQVPFEPQIPFTQSAATAQPLPSPHFLFVGDAAHEPPQSTAVSVPFFTLSVQLGTAQLPEVQTPLAQLAPAPVPEPHIFPFAQPGQEPPQSTSVSVLFFTPSAQLAAAQTPFRQTAFTQSPATAQAWPSGHFLFVGEAAHEPPQSTAVSVPFFTVSVQLGVAQTPAVQTPLLQLPPAAVPVPHILPFAQAGHEAPQSTSVSPPFFTVSVHAAGWHRPAVQTPLAQLAPLAPHPLPSAHFLFVGAAAQVPPQSTSVSVPLATASVHAAGVQVPVAPHTPLAQSPPPPHFLPSAHLRLVGAAAQVPPQSMSVSVPFETVSVHDGAAHSLVALGQTWLSQSFATAHALPTSQAGHDVLPQSTSVSGPFLIPSVQVGAWQSPPMQLPLWQSVPSAQVLLGAQAGQPDPAPPQSTSVSLPFWTLSVQVRAAHAPAAQTRLAQSPPTLHFWAAAQPGQGPPQSTSVSLLFFTASVHEGGTQRPAAHTPLTQSPGSRQAFPSWHLAQPTPPQSTSVSVPFNVRSAQLALWHSPAVQTPPRQSVAAAQALPVAHLAGQAPPQSTSVSLPFITISVQAPAEHTPPVHTPSWQSVATAHGWPLRQGGHGPPQSTPVSP